MPYQTNWSSYERVDGEINYQGKIYRYVKRRVYNSELILLCLPYAEKMKLQTARDDFFKFANDLQQNASSKKSNNSNTNTFKNVLNEFDHQHSSSFAYSFFPRKEAYDIPQNVNRLISGLHASPDQPPEKNKI